MSRPCTICLSNSLADVDSDLVRGVSNREIGRRYGFGKDSVARHGARHLSRALVAVTAGRFDEAPAHAVDAVAHLSRLFARAERLLDEAEQTGRVALALRAVDTMHSVLKTLGVGTGQLRSGSQVDARSVTINVQQSPEWIALRSKLVGALADYPEARLAVVAAFADPVEQPDPRRVAVVPFREEQPTPDDTEGDDA